MIMKMLRSFKLWIEYSISKYAAAFQTMNSSANS